LTKIYKSKFNSKHKGIVQKKDRYKYKEYKYDDEFTGQENQDLKSV